MKYTYLGTSPRVVHLKTGDVTAVKGTTIETEEKINHPLFVRVAEKKENRNVKTIK